MPIHATEPVYGAIDPHVPLPGTYTFVRAMRLDITLKSGSLNVKGPPQVLLLPPLLEGLLGDRWNWVAAAAAFRHYAIIAGFSGPDLAPLAKITDRERLHDAVALI